MNGLLVLAPVGSLLGLLYAAYLARWVVRQHGGTAVMQDISSAIREGAIGYLRQQYRTMAWYFLVMFGALQALVVWGGSSVLSPFVPFAFVTGGFFSALAGYLGMRIATLANCRTAQGASENLNQGLRVAFSAGGVMGFVVVGLGLLDLSLWYLFLEWWYGNLPVAERIGKVTETMLSFGIGASSVALFARVGGGIFTKAADVGADLVGKVEAAIPEDDPRNAATIADNVGDNVGDVAGMGADLYESYVGSIVATMALAVAATRTADELRLAFVMVPMLVAGVGVIASIVGSIFVAVGDDDAEPAALLNALRRGILISSVLIVIGSYLVLMHPTGRIGLLYAVLSGLVGGIVIGFTTEYYTSNAYEPARSVAAASRTGHATVVLEGIACGMHSTLVPVLTIGIAMLSSYWLAGGATSPDMGLYGVALAAVGMLSTLGITLATDAYGPVADNAGGIAEMAGMGPSVRRRTDALDSLGNTTAATGKGFAIGSAALTALALIAAYRDRLYMLRRDLHGLTDAVCLDLMDPTVLAALFIGAMLPFVFCAMTIRAVGRAAGSMVDEVRTQFHRPGVMEGTVKPEYAACVAISTLAAQREMVGPAVLAIAAPLLCGILLGPFANAGLLTGSLASGFLLAVFMANAGGAWDNAKKHIEGGHLGGKGSDNHKAAVTGDTVGDPFKDTSGPSINILVKLMSMVSIVFAGLFFIVR